MSLQMNWSWQLLHNTYESASARFLALLLDLLHNGVLWNIRVPQSGWSKDTMEGISLRWVMMTCIMCYWIETTNEGIDMMMLYMCYWIATTNERIELMMLYVAQLNHDAQLTC